MSSAVCVYRSRHGCQDDRDYADNGLHTATCFPDDLECIRLIKLLQSRGMQIPGDAGAVSWDGLTVSCYFSPMLETLAVPHDEMCRAAEKFFCGSSCGFIEFSPEIRSGETLPSIGIPAEK